MRVCVKRKISFVIVANNQSKRIDLLSIVYGGEGRGASMLAV